MMRQESDEETLFDQTVLIRRKSNNSCCFGGKQICSSKCWKTVLLCLAFFGLGLCIAIPGPTLLDLEEWTNSDTEHIAYIFTGRSVGYLGGSILGGVLFDRINQYFLLGFTLILASVATLIIPWCHILILMIIAFSFQGCCMGSLDTGGNVLCLKLWKEHNAPYMQALHFAFGLGAFLAPVISAPFLSNHTDSNLTHPLAMHVQNPPADALLQNNHLAATSPVRLKRHAITTNATTTMKPTKPSVLNGKHLNSDPNEADGTNLAKKVVKFKEKEDKKKEQLKKLHTTAEPDDNRTSISVTTTTTRSTTTTSVSTTTTKSEEIHNIARRRTLPPLNETNAPQNQTADLLDRVMESIRNISMVQFTYVSIGLFLMLMSCCAFLVCCCCRRDEDVMAKPKVHKESPGFRVQLFALLFLFFFCYVGMEVSYGSFIMVYSVKEHNWSKEKGALLTSVFWGSFASFRLLAIFLARRAIINDVDRHEHVTFHILCVEPNSLLICDLIVCSLSLSLLVIVNNEQFLWALTAMIGASMASVFPSGVSWAEKYVRLSGKAASVFVVGCALGEMALPVVIGFFMQNKSVRWMMYIIFGVSVLSAVLYIIMQHLASTRGVRWGRIRPDKDLNSFEREPLEPKEGRVTLEMNGLGLRKNGANKYRILD